MLLFDSHKVVSLEQTENRGFDGQPQPFSHGEQTGCSKQWGKRGASCAALSSECLVALL